MRETITPRRRLRQILSGEIFTSNWAIARLTVSLKEFDILIGNCELPVTAEFTILISKVINDQDKFSFTDAGDLSEFMLLSEALAYDLFILVFNNVRWNGAGSRNDKAIEVIERTRGRGTGRSLLPMDQSGRRIEPNAEYTVSVSQPKVARTSYLGSHSQMESNPVGVVLNSSRLPKVGAVAPTLG
jgi:hypothetical protein